MSKVNFSQLFGNILQFNMTQMMGLVVEQESEKDQMSTLLQQLKAGEIAVSQIEISKDGIRVMMPPESTPDLSSYSQEDLAKALALKIAVPVEEEDTVERGGDTLEELPENVNYQKDHDTEA